MEIVRAAHKGFAGQQEESPYGNVEDSLEAAAQRDSDDRLVKAGSKRKKKKRRRKPQTKHLDGLDWEVIVVQDKSVNAGRLPGGKIMVNTGFLDPFNTDAELATMLGHEVGHVIARHTSETLTIFMWIFVMTLYFQIYCGDNKSTREAVEKVMELFFRLPFSRQYVSGPAFLTLFVHGDLDDAPCIDALRIHVHIIGKTIKADFLLDQSRFPPPSGRAPHPAGSPGVGAAAAGPWRGAAPLEQQAAKLSPPFASGKWGFAAGGASSSDEEEGEKKKGSKRAPAPAARKGTPSSRRILRRYSRSR